MNPKNDAGRAKPSLTNIPVHILFEVAESLREGAEKYGRWNWRDHNVDASVYTDAALRHLLAWWEGENEDPDSGISHLSKAITNLIIIRDAQEMGALVDDRYHHY